MIRLPFNFVEYDGSPDRVIEPANHIDRFHNTSGSGTGNYQPVDPYSDGVGMLVGIEVFDATPFSDVMEFHWV
jgi:hypothetical protein